eukprot:scaffold149_cov179-Amphora_coffeaeformis.AAC.9
MIVFGLGLGLGLVYNNLILYATQCSRAMTAFGLVDLTLLSSLSQQLNCFLVSEVGQYGRNKLEDLWFGRYGTIPHHGMVSGMVWFHTPVVRTKLK